MLAHRRNSWITYLLLSLLASQLRSLWGRGEGSDYSPEPHDKLPAGTEQNPPKLWFSDANVSKNALGCSSNPRCVTRQTSSLSPSASATLAFLIPWFSETSLIPRHLQPRLLSLNNAFAPALLPPVRYFPVTQVPVSSSRFPPLSQSPSLMRQCWVMCAVSGFYCTFYFSV